MSSLFEEVYIHDYDEENLTFGKRFPDSLTLEVIDESDKLLIRSKAGRKHLENQIPGHHNEPPFLVIEIYKDTPCSEFTKSGFVVTDENGKSILLRFSKSYIYDNEKSNYAETDFCRFSKLVNDFKLGRRESVFTLRTDEASATQYFQFYGYLSQQQNMMQDYIRTSTYQRAILSNMEDFRGKIVLDVGAGSGILSFFAIQAGAKKVYAVEASSMAKHAETLVASNKLSDRIVVIPGKIEEITLPEQVDIIISEPMGYMLFNERMLETYLHAKKWLAPNGNMFPTRGDLHIAPFSDAQLYTEQLTKANFWFQQNFHGVDLTALRDAALKEYFYQPVVDTFDIRICMAKSNKHSVDFLKAHEKDLHTIDVPLKFQITQTDEIHGLAFWFDVAFFGSQQSVWLSTSPTQPLTHWYQVRCLIDKPLFVQRGQTVSGRVVLVSNSRQSYNVEIELQVDNMPGSRASNSLDLKNPYFRYTGQPIQPPPGCNTTSPSEDYWQQLDNSNTANNLSGTHNQTMMNGGGGLILNGVGGGGGLGQQPNLNGLQSMDPNLQQQQQQFVNGCPIPAAHMNNNQTMLNNVNNSISSSASSPLNCSLANNNRIMPTVVGGGGQFQQQQQQMSGLANYQTGVGGPQMVVIGGGNNQVATALGGTTVGTGNVSGINNMNFPVNQSLMIGDYAAAIAGQTIPPYKPI